MFTYTSEKDLIVSTANYTQSKIDVLTRRIDALENKNTLAYKVAIAERGAYYDVLYMLTEYAIRDKK